MANQWEVMSEYYREQHPLLCEDGSDEDRYSPRYYRRARPASCRARSRNNLKGAAAIFSRWTDHWTSFLTYWWIGIGMISLTTFIIYNSLFAFSMLPSVNMKPTSPIKGYENEKTTVRSSLLPDVFMHVFVGQNEDLDFDQYMPHVEIIANTFIDYKFHFIVLINDTNLGWMSAEENNELALNMLWTKNKNIFEKKAHSHNINIEHVTLSAYMDSSPLKKYWRVLPHQLIEFVARAISIWDKGGVAFNPDILTPIFQHTLYIDKLQKIFNKYAQTNKILNDVQFIKNLNKGSKRRKLNNIREIIDALEMEDISTNAFSQETLFGAEEKDIQFIRHERQVSAITSSDIKNDTKVNVDVPNAINSEMNPYSIGTLNQDKFNTIVNSTEPTYALQNNRNSTKLSLLPLFLKFLFNNKADTTLKPTEITPNNRTRSNISVSNKFLRQTEKETNNMYKPLIVSAAGIYNKSKYDINVNIPQEKDDNVEANRLTIDLKGNIIATDTACHAFLGTIFSNVIHHSEEETITDFIIAELTIFCKGLLSSCMGIDLILL